MRTTTLLYAPTIREAKGLTPYAEPVRSRVLTVYAVVLICVAVSGCASVGTGDPVIVRAEDVQVNSLSFYQTAMEWHFANSTKESPTLYRAFEKFRTAFPPAWKTLSAAIGDYKTGKTTGTLPGALSAVEQLTSEIKAIWTPAPVGGR